MELPGSEFLEEPARFPGGDHISVGEGEHDLRVSEGTDPCPVAVGSPGAFGENICPRCELLFSQTPSTRGLTRGGPIVLGWQL